MIKVPLAEAVNRKAPATDFTQDFLEGIEPRFPLNGNPEHPDSRPIRGALQRDTPCGWSRIGHIPIVERLQDLWLLAHEPAM